MPDLSTAGASYSRFLKNRKKKDGETVLLFALHMGFTGKSV